MKSTLMKTVDKKPRAKRIKNPFEENQKKTKKIVDTKLEAKIPVAPSTDYRITLSDGTKIILCNKSAGEAIEQARRDYRGRTVTRCYSGMTEEDCRWHREHVNSMIFAMPGIIEHEIPAHEPYGENEQLMTPTAKREDATLDVFAGMDLKGRLAD